VKVILLHISAEASVWGNEKITFLLSLLDTSCQEEFKPPDRNEDASGSFSSKILHASENMFSTEQG